MGAEQSQLVEPSHPESQNDDQFVLVVSAPPGVGKEGLMGRFMLENTVNIGYVAKAGSVSTSEPGLIYFYESISDPDVATNSSDSFPTITAAVDAVLRDNKSCVVDVDVAGVRELRAAGIPGAYVFFVPPSLEALHHSLQNIFLGRPDGQQKATEMAKFTENEISALREEGLYDFAVVNENENDAIMELRQCVIKKGRAVPARPGKRVNIETPPVNVPSTVVEQTKEIFGPPFSEPQYSAAARAISDRGEETSQTGSATPRAVHPSIRVENGSRPGDQISCSAGTKDETVVVPPGMARWAGSVALVTGATSPMGWAVCEALALADMRVVACANEQEKLESLQRHVLSQGINGHMFLPVVCDITKEAEVQTLNKLVAKQYEGRHISVLVNNVICSSSNTSLMSGDIGAWTEMLSINVLGIAMCCREVVQGMKAKNDWGHIINISSLSGYQSDSSVSSGGFCTVTSHAVLGIMEGLRLEAREMGANLRVSGIKSGASRSKLPASTSQRATEALKQYNTAALSAYDGANAALYMLSAPPNMEIDDVILRPVQHRA